MEKYTKIAVVAVLCVLAVSAVFLVALLLPQGSKGPSDYSQQEAYPMGGGGRFALQPEHPMPMPTSVPRAMPEAAMPKYAEKTLSVETSESRYTDADTERKIIRHASLRIEVEDFQPSYDSVIDIVERYKGFITDSHSYVSRTGRKSGDIAVRVPQDKFLEVIAEMGHLGDVKSKHISGEDITEEYIDLTARLNNSERQERRLLEILDMANNTKEVLEVERELWRVRGEIERLTGRINYLENRVELATIHVSLNEPEPITHSWGIRDALRSAFGGFVSVIRGLIIFAGYALPLLILVCIGWLVKSKLMPRLRKGKGR
ncbi:protein of unknown function (DUF4349) [Candidatus Methanophagaceae archaeon]|nr:protein of unknown function (DUF4349) [Methanophagales archaeon]